VNYRHHFHAGNFADVWKHVLLLATWEALQRKDKGLLYLETHAGRGLYDLGQAGQGDRLARVPEWPLGIGRVRAAANPPPVVARYLAAVDACAAQHAGAYPGSPWLVTRALRPQDRAVLAEWQAEEQAVLAQNLQGRPGVRVEHRDGYGCPRAYLPPPERRALVLIDPPYETEDEIGRVEVALREGLARLAGGTFVVWYPLTPRAGVEPWLARLRQDRAGPPAWTAELFVARGPEAPRMPGCGMLVVNPPWQLDQELAPALRWLAEVLAQDAQAGSRLDWLVPEA
jgi:23S rRNA (adenine2030-N6)-methyltransferase